MSGLLLSIFSSLVAIGFVYFLYWLSYCKHSKEKAYAECWWLPDYHCFRLVIRNITSKSNLTSITFRAWLRSVVPASAGSSVVSFKDQELETGSRIILPANQDLPITCFRLEIKDKKLFLVNTNKFGKEMKSYQIKNDFNSIMAEFSLKINSWFLFKHEITRSFKIPHYLNSALKKHDIFVDYLIPFQSGNEGKIKTIFETAREISVSI